MCCLRRRAVQFGPSSKKIKAFDKRMNATLVSHGGGIDCSDTAQWIALGTGILALVSELMPHISDEHCKANGVCQGLVYLARSRCLRRLVAGGASTARDLP